MLCPSFFRWAMQAAFGPWSLSTVWHQVVLLLWDQFLCSVLVWRLPRQLKQLWDWSQLLEYLCPNITYCLRKGEGVSKLTALISLNNQQKILFEACTHMHPRSLRMAADETPFSCCSEYVHNGLIYWTRTLCDSACNKGCQVNSNNFEVEAIYWSTCAYIQV